MNRKPKVVSNPEVATLRETVKLLQAALEKASANVEFFKSEDRLKTEYNVKYEAELSKLRNELENYKAIQPKNEALTEEIIKELNATIIQLENDLERANSANNYGKAQELGLVKRFEHWPPTPNQIQNLLYDIQRMEGEIKKFNADRAEAERVGATKRFGQWPPTAMQVKTLLDDVSRLKAQIDNSDVKQLSIELANVRQCLADEHRVSSSLRSDYRGVLTANQALKKDFEELSLKYAKLFLKLEDHKLDTEGKA